VLGEVGVEIAGSGGLAGAEQPRLAARLVPLEPRGAISLPGHGDRLHRHRGHVALGALLVLADLLAELGDDRPFPERRPRC